MMRLSWQMDFASIRQFSPIEIPDFTVLFGKNGAGKSQLLAAIANGHVRVSDENDLQLGVSNYASNFHQQNPFTFVADVDDMSPLIVASYATSTLMTDVGIIAHLGQVIDPRTLDMMRRHVTPSSLISLVSEKIRSADPTFKAQLENLVINSIINIFSQSPIYSQNHPLMQYVHSRPKVFTEVKTSQKIDQIARRQVDFNTPAVGQTFYDYWRRFKDHREKVELRDSTDFDYDLTDADFKLQNGEEPWKIYQEWIDQLGLTLKLRVPNVDEEQYRGVAISKPGIEQEIDPSQLSSGELVYLNIALSTLVTRDGMFEVKPPDVLLLDEPDAHLHPALCHELIDKILRPLSENRKLRIIMTTHSPTTVAVSTEKSIYEKINLSGLVKRDRQEAVNALMHGLSHVSLDPSGRRQVFVESKYDQENYSLIYDLTHHNLQSDRSLTFISCGINSSTDEHNAGKDKVIEFVQRLREAGNKSVFGLVDFDNQPQSRDGIFTLTKEAYGIENALLNPLAIGLLLVKLRPGSIDGIDFSTASLPGQNYDHIVGVIETKLGLASNDRINVALLGQREISVSRSAINMQCHKYADLVFAKIPEFRAHARNSNELNGTVIRHVYKEHHAIIPTYFVETFKTMLTWEFPPQ
jgi:predicted ATPase